MPKFVKKAAMLERITINPEQCDGKSCIRGMRIRVTDVLELLANGLTQEQVVDELEIKLEDVQAWLNCKVIVHFRI